MVTIFYDYLRAEAPIQGHQLMPSAVYHPVIATMFEATGYFPRLSDEWWMGERVKRWHRLGLENRKQVTDNQ